MARHSTIVVTNLSVGPVSMWSIFGWVSVKPNKFPCRFLLILLTILACPVVLAKDQITWGKHHVPPYMIQEGPRAHQGIFDLILDVLKARLPQYQHVELNAAFPRIINEIRNGNHWCFVGALKTPEREQYAYFSLPISIFLPLQVIVRKNDVGRFNHVESVQDLLRNRRLVTSVMRGRSYGPQLDPLLMANPPQENYSELKEAIGMLLAGHLDYLVESPLVAFDVASHMGHDGALTKIRTAEQGAITYDRILCPKNAWGQQTIERINEILLAVRGEPFYRRIVEKWNDPESVKVIRRIYDTEFLQAR